MLKNKSGKVIAALILTVGLAGYLLAERFVNLPLSVGIIGGSDGPTAIFITGAAEEGEPAVPPSLTLPEGTVLSERFRVPEGFERMPAGQGSFQAWLRTLPLKPDGAPVLYFDGREKTAQVHAAVVAMEIGSRDLQQCADAAIRLRAEYLYHSGRQDEIAFSFTNGFRADYASWRSGKRIQVKGNAVSWTNGGRASDDYETFRSYLDMVFAYAGTLSLSKELKSVPLDDLQAGDVFIQGGSPGHCVIVMDVAENTAGEKRFMLAQSYMPAQEIHILKNTDSPAQSPWYTPKAAETLNTPQWTFQWEDLKRFE